MASQFVIEATDANFEQEVLKSDLPVLVDYWATWCAPCKAIAPAVEKLAEELQGQVKVVKLEASQNMNTARAQKVSNLPTFVVYNGGQEVKRKIGAGGGLQGLKDLVSAAQ